MSSNAGSTMEQVDPAWREDSVIPAPCIPSFSDSGRDLYIRVQHWSGDPCLEYDLEIEGNTPIEEYNCNDL